MLIWKLTIPAVMRTSVLPDVKGQPPLHSSVPHLPSNLEFRTTMPPELLARGFQYIKTLPDSSHKVALPLFATLKILASLSAAKITTHILTITDAAYAEAAATSTVTANVGVAGHV